VSQLSGLVWVSSSSDCGSSETGPRAVRASDQETVIEQQESQRMQPSTVPTDTAFQASKKPARPAAATSDRHNPGATSCRENSTRAPPARKDRDQQEYLRMLLPKSNNRPACAQGALNADRTGCAGAESDDVKADHKGGISSALCSFIAPRTKALGPRTSNTRPAIR